jgi:hypothetical protein
LGGAIWSGKEGNEAHGFSANKTDIISKKLTL